MQASSLDCAATVSRSTCEPTVIHQLRASIASTSPRTVVHPRPLDASCRNAPRYCTASSSPAAQGTTALGERPEWMRVQSARPHGVQCTQGQSGRAGAASSQLRTSCGARHGVPPPPPPCPSAPAACAAALASPWTGWTAPHWQQRRQQPRCQAWRQRGRPCGTPAPAGTQCPWRL